MSYEYAIDSSAWIEYFEGTPKGTKIRKLIENNEIATSIIAVFELADKFEREKKDFENCLRFVQSRAEIMPVTVDIALKAAKLKNYIRREKNKFGAADAIHLATAISQNSVLITSDRDFTGLQNVMVI